MNTLNAAPSFGMKITLHPEIVDNVTKYYDSKGYDDESYPRQRAEELFGSDSYVLNSELGQYGPFLNTKVHPNGFPEAKKKYGQSAVEVASHIGDHEDELRINVITKKKDKELKPAWQFEFINKLGETVKTISRAMDPTRDEDAFSYGIRDMVAQGPYNRKGSDSFGKLATDPVKYKKEYSHLEEHQKSIFTLAYELFGGFKK